MFNFFAAYLLIGSFTALSCLLAEDNQEDPPIVLALAFCLLVIAWPVVHIISLLDIVGRSIQWLSK